MLPVNQFTTSFTSTNENTLEKEFENFKFKKLDSYILILKFHFDAAKSEKEKETVIRSIEGIEKRISDSDASHRNTLLSSIIAQHPDFAIQYMPFFKSSFDLEVDQSTVLINCCYNQQVEMVKSLIAHGADLNKMDFLNRTALAVCLQNAGQFSVSKDEDEIFNELIKAGCKVDIAVDLLNTPAHVKCAKKMLTSWTWKLLETVQDLNSKDNFGTQIIHQAVINHDKNMVKFLIKKGVELNGYMKNGFEMRSITACHIAVAANNHEILQMLVEHGADPHLRALTPHFGKYPKWEPISAFTLAVDTKKNDCVNVMVKAKKPTSKDLVQGFTRSLINKPAGSSHINLQMLAESTVNKITLNKTNIEGVNCFAPQTATFIKTFFENYFTKTYSPAANLYTPVWEMVKTHSKINPQFSMIFSNEDKGMVCGAYNSETKTEISVYYPDLTMIELAGSLVHEMTHKCAHIIYHNKFNLAPFDAEHPQYQQIQREIAYLEKSKSLMIADLLQERYLSVEDHYNTKQHPAEYLARMPQVILHLIYEYNYTTEQVYDCMQVHLPTLFNIYITEFLPACEKYIAENKMLPIDKN